MKLELVRSISSCLRPVVAFVLALAYLSAVNAFSPTSRWRQRPPAFTFASIASLSNIDSDFVATNDPVLAVCHYTKEAILHRGQPKGFAALEKLGELCANRRPYEFNDKQEEKDGTVVARQKDLLPLWVTEAFLEQVKEMEQNGWLSTNPDSVDGLPSLHLNLVSGGKPAVSLDRETPNDFQNGLQKLLTIVEPYLYEQLLPNVQTLMNDPSIAISDIFLRRYGEDILHDGASSRNGISAHYDIFSKVTAVIAMDNVASSGDNGLYTTATTALESTAGKTSNHASLRRYFPLKKGDGVVHSWDVLHGVNVLPGLDRTSLIVWFTTEDVLKSPDTIMSPWLVDHPEIETDDVAQFVLASATEDIDASTSPSQDSMHHQDERHSLMGLKNHPHDLYLKSAASGNAFALTRLGSLSQEGVLSLERASRGLAILEQLRPQDGVPLKDEILKSDGTICFEALANRFWFEGAVRGNPLAQVSLADELMEQSVQRDSQDLRVLASVMFGLAAQQGHESALASLSRVIKFEVAQSSIETPEDFESSPVIRTARSAIS